MAHDLAVARTTEEGQVNLDKCGYTVHEDFLRAPELAALRERLEEQAELERAAGVATLSGSGHAAKDKYIGAPKPDERVGYQMVSFLVNKGRVFLDLLHNPVIHDYAAHLFRGEPYNLATHNGVILHKGSSSQVLHADQQAIPLVLDRPVMFAMMICLSDFEADMGATLVAPGSHRFPLPQLDGEPAEAGERDRLGACAADGPGGVSPVLGEPDVARPGWINIRQGPGVDRKYLGSAFRQAAGLFPRDCSR